MRNELAHMMQLANKDREIYQLKQDNENIKVQHEESLALKDAEIAKIKKALEEAESALSQAQDKLAVVNEEHSKIIEALMETQHKYHELKNESWMSPLWNFF